MKKIFTLILLQTIYFLNAQLDKIPVDVAREELTIKEVGFMAVFPGCERLNIHDKAALQSCMSKELSSLLTKEIESFSDKMDEQGLISAVAKVQFVIDKSGKLVQVKALTGGNAELGLFSEQGLKRIAQNIKKIQPAILDDGTPVNLVFQLPIKFLLTDSKINEFDWNELVLVSLINENEKFEIRENVKEKKIKIYDVAHDQNLFLGNFNSFEEILALEPYRTMYFQNERALVAEQKIDDTVYKLYYSKDHKDYFDAYKIVAGNEEFIESFPKENIEFSSIYLKLILRN